MANQAPPEKESELNAPIAKRDLWRSRLLLANYEVREAARFAHVSSNTVRRWHKNTTLGSREPGSKLSYLQLIELAVAAACKDAGMKLADIRSARSYFAGKFNTDHPFATLKLQTDGVDLAIKAGADLLIGNRNGQLAWKQIIGERFKEFEYEDGLAVRWHVAGKNSEIIIDPRIQYGAPTVDGVPTWAIKGRWEAGEQLADIADDFGISSALIRKALSFEGVDLNAERSTWKR